MQTVNLQHMNVKLLLRDSAALDRDRDLAPVIPVFHSWIQEQSFEELLLDVADYRHVQGGPGILLIGHEADYSIDNTDNRLGVRYNRKAVLDGNNQHRLTQAALAALNAAHRLQEDTRLNGKLYFNGQDIEIFVNDRLLAPNSAATREALEAEFQAFSELLFAGSQFSLSFSDDPRRLLAVSLRSARPVSLQELIGNLKSADPNPVKHPPGSASSKHALGELQAAQGAD